MFILLPVNIVATYCTGDWPPVGLEFLSISAMNYQHGKASKSSNHLWYWAPTIGTWIFSCIIAYQMIQSSKTFILFRQKYYNRREETIKLRLPTMSPTELLQQQKQDLISRTLIVHFDNGIKPPLRKISVSSNQHYIIPNDKVRTLVDSKAIKPSQQVLVGKHNNKVSLLIKDYNRIIKSLEKVLNKYLRRVNDYQQKHGVIDGSTAVERPLTRKNWKSKLVDAIDYYTERALVLEAAIKRNRLKLQNNSYGWVIYTSKPEAHEAYLALEKVIDQRNKNDTAAIEKIRLAPHPNDIVWTNMNIDSHTGQLKRWFGYGLFVSVVFVWSIPIAILALLSNTINLIRLFPKSAEIINNNQLIMGIIQSYVAPCLMVLFHIGLPTLLRFISRQQSYKTETVLQQKILSKLYAFFVVNNLFIFTLVSIMVGIMGQISALTIAGRLKNKSLSQYIVQIAKNMTDVSSFWISYVCIRSVTIIFELLQFAPLLWIIILRGKGYFNYTPRQLDKVTGPPPCFDFAKNYGLVISFFTAALVYSVTAPIVLPFALIYFGLATTIFKYKLMFIYITKVETHGMIWPMLYCIVMISLLVFQLMMILILSLKAGVYQIYALIPLPVLTTIVLVLYTRHLLKHNTLKTWIELNNRINPQNPSSSSRNSSSSIHANVDDIELTEMATLNSTTSNEIANAEEEDPLKSDARLINSIYKDPSIHDPLWKPMLFDDLKKLVPDVYKNHSQRERILRTLYSDDEQPESLPKCDTLPTSLTTTTAQGSPVEENALTPVQEKQRIKDQLELEMKMYPPTPQHIESSSSSYYRYYQEQEDQGSSSQRHLLCYSHEPVMDEDDDRMRNMADPTAPPLDMFQSDDQDEAIAQHIILPPPPNYADVVSPRANIIAQLPPQSQRPPLRRHSVS
ncbi:unnamed protein product [Mucor hiemalis]